MKKTVYIETTIPSYYFNERKSIRTFVEITKQWWQNERLNYDIWIFEEVLDELNAGNYPNKGQVLEFSIHLPILPPDKSIVEVAQIYLDNYLMPQVLKGDAIHLACASFYKMDFLLTWNCNHLANANKRQHLRRINTRLNLSTPDIVTPLELFTEEKNDY